MELNQQGLGVKVERKKEVGAIQREGTVLESNFLCNYIIVRSLVM